MRRSNHGRRAGWAVAAALLVASGIAGVGAPARAGTAQADAPSPLSARLQELADLGGTPSISTQADAADLPRSGAGSLGHDDQGRLYVDIWGTTLAAVAQAASVPGATLVATGTDGLTATIAVPPSSLTDLTAVRGLRSAREAIQPKTASMSSTGTMGSTGRVAAADPCPTGVHDGGNEQLKVALARTTYGVDGAGVPIGVISDSFGSNAAQLAANIAAGDLPGATNPCGDTTPVKVLFDGQGTDEGQAMLQIVHDLAPKAPLLFADSGVSQIDMANHIRALRDAGARVIVDDISYGQETFYQDGPIAAAVDEVTSQGVVYFSSAANSNTLAGGGDTGTSIGSYEAQAFRPIGCPAGIPSGYDSCHDFDPGPGESNSDRITMIADNGLTVSAGWSEPAFGVTTNLDFFVLAGGSPKVLSSATDDNIIGGQPTEYFSLDSPSQSSNTNVRFVVARRNNSTGPGPATPRFKWIFDDTFLQAAQWDTSTGGDVVGPTIYGHSKTLVSAGVAATPVTDATKIEPYSSRGPVSYCWQPVDGTTVLSGFPCQDATVDFTATDAVHTSVAGLDPFSGTSAAAPHAAAVAALMLQDEPCRKPAEVLTALRSGAKPLAGYDADAQGAGLVDAVDAIAGLTPCGNVPGTPGAPSVTAAGPASVDLSWTAPTGTGGSPITGYEVLVTDQHDMVVRTDVLGPATTATLTGLAGGAYRFAVRAKGAADSAYSPVSALVIPPFTTLDAFTDRQFRDFANHPATGAEKLSWSEQLIADEYEPAALIEQAADLFPSWGPKLDGVTRLYYAFFQRPPDPSGLNHWLTKRRNGTTLVQISQSFVASSEFRRTYGTLSNAQFVNLVYANVLGRSPDAAGAAYWTKRLDQRRTSRGQLMANFSESTENVARRQGEVATVSVIFGMLRRVPTAAELTTWAASAKMSKRPLIDFVLVSSAYAART